MSKANVTVVMSPRERFNLTRRSVESLYDDPGASFEFICVDGGSPKAVRDYLRRESVRRGFKLIQTANYLSPNDARNLAYDAIRTKYVAFVDNDVDFAPGWLKYLLECAEETGADVISPLICIYEPVHTIVHMAGGEADIVMENGQRVFREKHHFLELPVAEVRDQLERRQVGLAEYHCMLVRTDMLHKVGRFDAALKGTSDHTDFCLLVRKHGGTIMLEPRSVVTNVVGPPLALNELPYFFYRWSDEWSLSSERHFSKKWDTVSDDMVYLKFVLQHRRLAFPRARRMAHTLIGWRLSEWVFSRIAEFFVWVARRSHDPFTSSRLKVAFREASV